MILDLRCAERRDAGAQLIEERSRQQQERARTGGKRERTRQPAERSPQARSTLPVPKMFA
jgi:hypothetical protein